MQHFLVIALLFVTICFADNATAHQTNEIVNLEQKMPANPHSLVDTIEEESNSNGGLSFWLLVIVIALLIIFLMGFSFYSYKRAFVKKK